MSNEQEKRSHGRPRKERNRTSESVPALVETSGLPSNLIKKQMAPINVSIGNLVDQADGAGQDMALFFESGGKTVRLQLLQPNHQQGRAKKKLTLEIEGD